MLEQSRDYKTGTLSHTVSVQPVWRGGRMEIESNPWPVISGVSQVAQW